jgi:hypothetical protein
MKAPGRGLMPAPSIPTSRGRLRHPGEAPPARLRLQKIHAAASESVHRAAGDPRGAISSGTAGASFEVLSVNEVFTLRTCGAAVSSAMKA